MKCLPGFHRRVSVTKGIRGNERMKCFPGLKMGFFKKFKGDVEMFFY